MRPLAALLLTLITTAPAWGQDSAALRAQIGAERRAVQGRYAEATSACNTRFLLTDCMNEAKAERRNALAALREQELRLADTERRQRAAVRKQEVQRKQAQAATRATPAVSSAASAPRPARAASAPPPQAAAASRPALDGGPQTAAERAQRKHARQQEAEERRERIAQRQLKHDSKSRKAAPLPQPASSAAKP